MPGFVGDVGPEGLGLPVSLPPPSGLGTVGPELNDGLGRGQLRSTIKSQFTIGDGVSITLGDLDGVEVIIGVVVGTQVTFVLAEGPCVL